MTKTPGRRPTVVLVGTLDTKGHEYAFVRDRITARGVDVLLVDAGILGEPLVEPSVTRQEVAAAAGADVRGLADAGDRSAAIEVMGRGATKIVRSERSAARAGRRSPRTRCGRFRSAYRS
jgi:uncharacterized protein (UPF0261 family)